MADIFISYAREDVATAQRLAEALEAQGWSVFWDRRIPAGRRFDDFISEQLQAASCVIVLWSTAAVRSEWVIEEAAEARERDVLAPALIDMVKPPFGFRHRQAADLINWQQEKTHAGFQRLIHDISSLLAAPAKPGEEERQQAEETEEKQRRQAAEEQQRNAQPQDGARRAAESGAARMPKTARHSDASGRRLKLITAVALVILVGFAGVFAWQRWPSPPAEVTRMGEEKPVVAVPAPAPEPTKGALKPLDTSTDCKECPEMVIPGGTFTMGSPATADNAGEFFLLAKSLPGGAVSDRQTAEPVSATALPKGATPGAAPMLPPIAAEPTPSEITQAQTLLAQLGYNPGPADGSLGQRTRAAVETYQRRAGLPVDGAITPALLAGLLRVTPAPPVTQPVPPDKPSPIDPRISTTLDYSRQTSEAAQNAQSRARSAAQHADYAAGLARAGKPGYQIIRLSDNADFSGEIKNGKPTIGVVIEKAGNACRGYIGDDGLEGYGICTLSIGMERKELPGEKMIAWETSWHGGVPGPTGVITMQSGTIVETSKCADEHQCINVLYPDGSRMLSVGAGIVQKTSFGVRIDGAGKLIEAGTLDKDSFASIARKR